MSVQDWFLPAVERGNPKTRIDQRRGDGKGWTTGNDVQLLVHGGEYFPRLYHVLCALQADDWIHFTDWRGDPDERLNGPGTEIARVLADCARRGVHVRGLVWRSHSDKAHFSEEENLHLVETVNEAGGEVLLDERVRGAGSHHQKLFVIRRPENPDDDVAFVGGIDLCHGRNDTDAHLGDPQAIELDDRYGPTPAWHDVQIEVRGPAVGDLAYTFRERWEDPTPVDHRNPVRARLARVAHEPKRPDPMPPMPADPAPRGHCAIQVVRTYAARRPPYPFAPEGERSIARTYQRVFRRAQRLIYLEDQYLWLEEAADAVVAAVQRAPALRVIAVVPRHPDRDGRFSGPPYRIAQQRVFERIAQAAGPRFAVFDLENAAGRPVYVHAKACVVDDVWMIVGSDNLNRRSWTNDSELSCAIIDERRDERAPHDPAGLGEGARVLPRDTRLRLWREHLQRADDDDEDLVDPESGFAAMLASAQALDAWHEGGEQGPRPRGHLRVHAPEPVSGLHAAWAGPIYRLLVDPDGRPGSLRRRNAF
jgi:phosphatidylserine/phosphatidylglycerophosphate/cardiolipin synthase-like enzyme